MKERTIPLGERKGDIVFLVFFCINLFFITYIVDVEQIILPDITGRWDYPLWPPRSMVDMVHWYGSSFDPVLMARPMWWKATIWIDSLLFGPYYVAAIYAFVKGKNWIRMPSAVYAGLMIANVTIILFEEAWGTHATPHFGFVLALNAPWFLLPIALLARLWRERPFSADTQASTEEQDDVDLAASPAE